MGKTVEEFIQEGIAGTTSEHNRHIDPYRVLSYLLAQYPEIGFIGLPSARDIREYIEARDPSRSFERLGSGDYSFYIEPRLLERNEVQPRSEARKRGTHEVTHVSDRADDGRFRRAVAASGIGHPDPDTSEVLHQKSS